MSNFLSNFLFGKPSEQQQSSQYSTQQQQYGGNASVSSGSQQSGSQSTEAGQSASTQNIAFEDLFSKLFGGASAAAGAINTSPITTAANQLFTGGANFLSTLEGGAASGVADLVNRAGDSSALDAQLGALKTSLGDFLNEKVLPGVTAGGVATGTLGGDRQAVEKAMAAKAVASQFAQGAASLIGTDQQQKDQAAMALAQYGPAALTVAPGLLSLTTTGAEAPLAPYTALKGVLGAPTVLSSSESTTGSQSTSQSTGQQGSQSYGFNFGSSSGSGSSQGTSVGAQQAGLGQLTQDWHNFFSVL